MAQEQQQRYPIKLVRDRIRDVPNIHGGELQVWAVGSTSKNDLLRAKLLEEVGEFLISGDVEELADILEVCAALAKAEGTTWEELSRIRLRKRKERGGFDRGHVLFAYPANRKDTETQ